MDIELIKVLGATITVAITSWVAVWKVNNGRLRKVESDVVETKTNVQWICRVIEDLPCSKNETKCHKR